MPKYNKKGTSDKAIVDDPSSGSSAIPRQNGKDGTVTKKSKAETQGKNDAPAPGSSVDPSNKSKSSITEHNANITNPVGDADEATKSREVVSSNEAANAVTDPPKTATTSGTNPDPPTGSGIPDKKMEVDASSQKYGPGRKMLKKQSSTLKVDTSAQSNGVAGHNTSGTAKSPVPGGGTMDNHPYARASVVEVVHGVDDPSDDHWWSEDSSEERDGEGNDESKDTSSVRLCDIIDRKPIGPQGSGTYRYYVHYRDFNRRMDEWISMERIVSPPSVGNAKARAIKKEEEKEKRKLQRLEEKKAADLVDVSAPRASRRRTTPNAPGEGGSALNSNHSPTPLGISPAEGYAAMDSETPRRSRSRRRTTFDDDGTIVAGNHPDFPSEETKPPPVIMAAEKGEVAMPTQAAHTHTVGEHVVATIPAQELDEHEGLDEASLREHEEVTKVKNVAFLELGAYQMETWYFSPLPKELLSERGFIEVLYVCEFSFNMFSRKTELQRFQSRLPTHARHPPGNEIYRKGNLSMFEVDGFQERIYCQNLCYIAKLFLDHKTLYYDVDPFLFYVFCEVDDRGFHPVGYYSKEKYSDVGFNLACILTFPCQQRKGYGRFLIAFSYELSKKEEKVGSPEKPMSDLGQQAYKPYWASTIVDFLLQKSDSSSLSIMDISKTTSIMAEDIVFTLNQLGILKIINGVYFIAAEEGLLKALAKKYPVKKPRVDPTKLHWAPFVTDVKRDKFSIHSKKPSVDGVEQRGRGGFP